MASFGKSIAQLAGVVGWAVSTLHSGISGKDQNLCLTRRRNDATLQNQPKIRGFRRVVASLREKALMCLFLMVWVPVEISLDQA
jgi:hypothetical protein